MADAIRQDRVMRLHLWSRLSPLVLALAVLVFAVDQAHKWWMLNVFDIGARQPHPVTSFFDLVLVWNQGVSYGLFTTHTQGVLIGFSLVITAVLWLWSCRVDRALAAAALALIIGGALANALDRLIRGAVADFFYFHVGSFDWYVFNIADMAIVAGVGLLLYEQGFDRGAGNRRGNA
jgi:signal peptidase II